MLLRFLGLTLALGDSVNPITRVAQLLQGLSDKIESDGKAETKLYDDFVCWCKTIESQKTLSNEVADQRIKDLEAYIDDIKNGRIEFTTERVDLEKEIAELQNQLEKEKADRDQARSDYKQAESEMNAAKDAISKAITILGTATKDAKSGVLLNVRFSLRKVLYPNKSNHLAYVEETIEKALAPPKDKDWAKLDGDKSTFSKKYKGRSFKIQDTLGEMRDTFSASLAAATKAEGLAQSDYEKLRERKKATLANRKDAAVNLDEENAARDKTAAESQAEKDDLEAQVKADTKILAETSATCATKKEEFVERSRLRTEEVASISEAIGVLRSDDARDTFNSSFDSQTPDFLQTSHHHKVSKGCAQARNKKAVRILTQVDSSRLRTVSFLVAAKADTTKFPQNVIAKIDSILVDLEKEGSTDEKDKNECEKLRATKTQEAKDHSNSIDDNSEEIARQNEIIEKLTATIEEKQENVKAIETDVTQAKEQRGLENAEYVRSEADDNAAVGLIEKATEALKKFYTDNQLALLQARATPPELEAGKAPPPPPQTWEEPYGGQKSSHTGVVAILGLIKEDVEKDIRVSKEEEAKAQNAHDTFVTESEAQIANLNGQIDAAKIARAEAKDTVKSEKGERTASKDVLAQTIGAIQAEEPKCNYITINFDVRKTNRYAEKDGLEKARSVLKGAKFGFLEC